MTELLKINVNDHTERKNGLTYLSWAWAWAEVLKIDPAATWEPLYFGPEANDVPYLQLPDGSMMVGVTVQIKGHDRQCLLPVMDHRNKAIKNPDAFAVNTAMMRCLAKCIAMHGLGLYIYAGEDLPEGDEEKPAKNEDTAHSGPAIIFNGLDEDTKRRLRVVALSVIQAMPNAQEALEAIESADLDNDQRAGLWSLLDSSTRSALKRAKEAA